MMHGNTPFTVAGMSGSSSSGHAGNAWGSLGSSTGGTANTSTSQHPFGESLTQSTRSHYQSGYLMSATQNPNSAPGTQRVDEVPVVQTKAKLNQVLTRGSGNTSDFGMESMFQSTRQRQNLAADEDAPPISSVNDIPHEVYTDNSPRFQPRNSTFATSQFKRLNHSHAPSSPFTSSPSPNPTTTTAHQATPLYIIVFGYPSDKYSLTVEYFKSLGATTEADPNTEIQNCFRIGFADPGEALRAVRKNGEVLSGSWMVGVKWADPALAENLLGQQQAFRSPNSNANLNSAASNGDDMQVDDLRTNTSAFPSNNVFNTTNSTANNTPYSPHTPTLGTPLRLEPSTSAFKKPGVASKAATSTPSGFASSTSGGGAGHFGFGGSTNGGGGGFDGGNSTFGGGAVGGRASLPQPNQAAAAVPGKSMLGTVSDLIFGW